MSLNLEVKVKSVLAYAKMTQTEVAKQMGMSRGNFNKKLKRETFTEEELNRIAEIVGATYHCYFEFPDGTQVE